MTSDLKTKKYGNAPFYIIGISVFLCTVFAYLGAPIKIDEDFSTNQVHEEKTTLAEKKILCKEQISSIKTFKTNVNQKQYDQGVKVFVETKTGQTYEFVIENFDIERFDGYYQSNCHIYAVRIIHDYTKSENKIQSVSLWRYTYDGVGDKLIDLFDRTSVGESGKLFSFSVFVDPQEQFIILENYFSSQTHKLYFKKLPDLEDIFTVDVKEYFNRNNLNNFSCYIDFHETEVSDNRKYIVLGSSFTTEKCGYFKIDIISGIMEYFDLPVDEFTVYSLNIDTGWVFFDGRPNFFSFDGDDSEEKAYVKESKETGRIFHHGVYNIFTKEKIVITEYGDFYFFPRFEWIDEYSAWYFDPSGEKKIYTLPQ
ncbi:MAG: hypothetical protein KBC42_01625 [Candidatus Pacebacteria bacterium]|jgi:hypothetical protein|nr:hypothetical protein [Candidatus Paceibacterota bacterium]MBP9780605.1 hypothetical protein [Candidatus Paceibacterota bacterium]